MERSDMSEPKPLSQFIEKIIETGTLSREDQNEINRLATKNSYTDRDSEAVQKLTNLITEGRVSVVN